MRCGSERRRRKRRFKEGASERAVPHCFATHSPLRPSLVFVKGCWLSRLTLHASRRRCVEQAKGIGCPRYVICTVPDFEPMTPSEFMCKDILVHFLDQGRGQQNKSSDSLCGTSVKVMYDARCRQEKPEFSIFEPNWPSALHPGKNGS